MADISYFLSLPDDILEREVFMRLPIDVISKLCQVHSRFNDICQDNRFWKSRVINEYPLQVQNKPKSSS